ALLSRYATRNVTSPLGWFSGCEPADQTRTRLSIRAMHPMHKTHNGNRPRLVPSRRGKETCGPVRSPRKKLPHVHNQVGTCLAGIRPQPCAPLLTMKSYM